MQPKCVVPCFCLTHVTRNRSRGHNHPLQLLWACLFANRHLTPPKTVLEASTHHQLMTPLVRRGVFCCRPELAALQFTQQVTEMSHAMRSMMRTGMQEACNRSRGRSLS